MQFLTLQPFSANPLQPSVSWMATFMRLFLHTYKVVPSGIVFLNFWMVATCAKSVWFCWVAERGVRETHVEALVPHAEDDGALIQPLFQRLDNFGLFCAADGVADLQAPSRRRGERLEPEP